MNTAIESTASAAKALDQLYPGWYDCVDIATLDLFSPENCLLAQIDRQNRVWRKLWSGKGWIRMEKEVLEITSIKKCPGLFASNNSFRDLWIKEIEVRRTPWGRRCLQPPPPSRTARTRMVAPFASQGAAIHSVTP